MDNFRAQMNKRYLSLLNELPREQRVAYLAECLRKKIAVALNLPENNISLEASFESLNAAWADLQLVYDLLQDIIEQQLGRQFYSWEIIRSPPGFEPLNTILTLAKYLVEEIDIPVPEGSFTDPFEGGHFAWKLPGTIASSARRNPPMVFLLSCPRAGSTLLRVMLEGHPNLFAPPELYLLGFESMGERKHQVESLGYAWFRDGLVDALMQAESLSKEVAQNRLADLEAKDISIQQMYQILQDKISGGLLVDKTPLYSTNQQILKHAESIFDGAKYLCLVRHPYSVIESIVRMRFHHGLLGNHIGIWDNNPWLYAEKWWTAAYLNILDFCETMIEPTRHHLVRYENLITNPKEVHAQICDFLGLPFDEKVLNPYAGERMKAGPGDPNLRIRDRVEPGLVAWQDKRPPQTPSLLMQELAAKLGYELD